ncbi:hypothetical protein F5884DRAFT_760878 [Xylogone sp. PMI_703]|nr:hypothetical protein F5884DRAFT_760878 [Xylogone sp. PMI_703]
MLALRSPVLHSAFLAFLGTRSLELRRWITAATFAVGGADSRTGKMLRRCQPPGVRIQYPLDLNTVQVCFTCTQYGNTAFYRLGPHRWKRVPFIRELDGDFCLL